MPNNRLLLTIIAAMTLVATPAAFADVDLAGPWGQLMSEDRGERGEGPLIGDYVGLPINEAARFRADTWSPTKWSVPEHQCEPHPVDYAPFGPASMIVEAVRDPQTFEIIAWEMTYSWMTPKQTIWMDGRPPPPDEAPYTWMGFSRGHWVGDILVVEITHLKEGWIRRNGIARSDRANVTQYWIRHGDILQLVTEIEDPVYLTEPLVRSVAWEANVGYNMGPYTCSARVETEFPEGFAAHFLPGENTMLMNYTDETGVPFEASRGGAETQYPEYMETLERLLEEKAAAEE